MWRQWRTAKVVASRAWTTSPTAAASRRAPWHRAYTACRTQSLDTPWPKVTRAVTRFACSIASRVDVDTLVRLLENRELARDSELPSTGVPYEWERALSSIQIRANGYGTRASTVITVRNDGLTTFFERSYDTTDPQRFFDRHYEFTIDRAASPARIKAPGTWLVIYKAHRISMCGIPASSYSSPYAQ